MTHSTDNWMTIQKNECVVGSYTSTHFQLTTSKLLQNPPIFTKLSNMNSNTQKRRNYYTQST